MMTEKPEPESLVLLRGKTVVKVAERQGKFKVPDVVWLKLLSDDDPWGDNWFCANIKDLEYLH